MDVDGEPGVSPADAFSPKAHFSGVPAGSPIVSMYRPRGKLQE